MRWGTTFVSCSTTEGDERPRAVLPVCPAGHAGPAVTTLQEATVHDDEDDGHMWLDQDRAEDGDSDDDAMGAAPAAQIAAAPPAVVRCGAECGAGRGLDVATAGGGRLTCARCASSPGL